MIQDADIDQRQGIAQPVGQLAVGLARLGDAAGVIVGEDHSGRMMTQGTPYDLTGVDRGAVERALADALEGQYTMLGVEQQRGKHLVMEIAQLVPEVGRHGVGVLKRRTSLQGFGEVAAGHLQDRLQLRKLGGPQARLRTEVRSIRLQQGAQAAEVMQQPTCQVHRTFAGHPRAQEDGQQFGIGEGGGAGGQQALIDLQIEN